MSDFNPNPVVHVKHRKGQLTIRRCPFCSKKHYHGDGGVAGPRFGHRLAHCVTQQLPDALRDVVLGYHLELEAIDVLKLEFKQRLGPEIFTSTPS